MDNKTIEICPHCGRLAWWPELACVHCGCLLTDYKKWIKADDTGKAEILSKIKQPKEYKPMYGPNYHPERIERADRIDAQIRKYLAEQGSKPPEKPKYVPKCPTCGSPDIEKISGTSKAVSFALFGIFSNKVKHQFKCKNCGYEW